MMTCKFGLFLLCSIVLLHKTTQQLLSCGENIHVNSSSTPVQYYFDSNMIEYHEDCFIKFITDKPSIISIKEFSASSVMHLCNEDHYLTFNTDCNSHINDLKICNLGIEHIFNNFTLEFSSCLFLGMKTFKKTSNRNEIKPPDHANTSDPVEKINLKLTLTHEYKPANEDLKTLSHHSGGLVSLISEDFVTNWQMFLLEKKDNYGGFLFTNINNGKVGEVICMNSMNYQVINHKLRIIQFKDLNELNEVKSILRNSNQTAFIEFLNKQPCNLISTGSYYFNDSPLILVIKVGYDESHSSMLLYLPVDKIPAQTVTLPAYVPILVIIIISLSFIVALLSVILIKRRLQRNLLSYDECDLKESSPDNTRPFLESA